jgi:hypothetical protein
MGNGAVVDHRRKPGIVVLEIPGRVSGKGEGAGEIG